MTFSSRTAAQTANAQQGHVGQDSVGTEDAQVATQPALLKSAEGRFVPKVDAAGLRDRGGGRRGFHIW